MTKQSAGDSDLTRYLLGELPDEERTALEEKYFADDELFEKLVEAQNDLVDAYVNGNLTTAQRKRFEQQFLPTGAASEDVKFATTLQRAITARHGGPAPRRVRRLRTILMSIAVLLVLAGAGSWLLTSTSRRDRVVQTRRATSAPVVQMQRPSVAPARVPPFVTLLLTPGSTRGSAAQESVELRQAPQFVRVELLLEENRFQSYRAELQDVDGNRLWQEGPLRPEGKKVVTDVPARLLQPGDYIVLLHGIRGASDEEAANYAFTVAARAH